MEEGVPSRFFCERRLRPLSACILLPPPAKRAENACHTKPPETMSYGRQGGSDQRGSGPPNIDGMVTLKVDNIAFTCSPEELREVFEGCGKLGDVYIPRDMRTGEPRGFAFVRYLDKRDADDAVDRLDGTRFNGRELRIQYARKRRPGGGGGGGYGGGGHGGGGGGYGGGGGGYGGGGGGGGGGGHYDRGGGGGGRDDRRGGRSRSPRRRSSRSRSPPSRHRSRRSSRSRSRSPASPGDDRKERRRRSRSPNPVGGGSRSGSRSRGHGGGGDRREERDGRKSPRDDDGGRGGGSRGNADRYGGERRGSEAPKHGGAD
ncbi:unnamed protein product [Ectocarpus sp. 12 AP-2014]